MNKISCPNSHNRIYLLKLSICKVIIIDCITHRCADQQTKSNTPLYIGGIDNVFSIPEEADIRSYDFNGEISAIIIDNTQLDTSCPFQYNGVLNGSHLTHLCTPLTNPCNMEYSSCVSYTANDNICQCKSGFPYDSCDDLEGQCCDYNNEFSLFMIK